MADYLDTSALVELVVAEAETAPFSPGWKGAQANRRRATSPLRSCFGSVSWPHPSCWNVPGTSSTP